MRIFFRSTKRVVAVLASLGAVSAAYAQPVKSADAATPYPGAAILANFGQACGDLSSMANAEAGARKAGWEIYNPTKDSQVAQLLDFGMSAAAKMTEGDKDYKTDVRVLRTTIAGRKLDLMITEVNSFGSNSIGCRMVDFGADVAIDDASIDAWARSVAPDAAKPQRAAMKDVLTTTMWRPGLFAGHEKTQVAFVPQTSAMKQALHLSGNNLMTQTRN